MRGVHKIVAIWIAVLANTTACDSQARSLYQDKQYGASAQAYLQELSDQRMPQYAFNAGNALYRTRNNYPTALTLYSLAATLETEAQQRGDALYNAGNAAFNVGDLQRAISLYRAALDERDDEDTRVNLEIAKRLLQQRMQKRQQQAKQQQSQDQNQEQDQSQEQDSQQQSEQNKQDKSNQGQDNKKEEGHDEQQQAGDQDNQAQKQPQSKPGDEPSDNKEPKQASTLAKGRLERLKEGNPVRYGSGNLPPGAKPW